ncbi:MAG: DUF3877 family protein [Bacteroidales bacterium]|nr:DUF3877 family protein [Bacteroidales bacterium]
MNYQNLENNIIDILVEQQLKLGYEKGAVSLYYPAKSLINLLKCESYSLDELDIALREFADFVRERIGEISLQRTEERYRITIPEAGSEYVHDHMGDTSFLQKFLATIWKHGCTIEQILDVFYEFSSNVIFKKMERQDFDYLIYFEAENIDTHRYCIKKEGSHMIYHRYTKEDYIEFGF